ncbi:exosome complex component CSL4 (macronuclear) [Tetrahymena thermophila SB210]|uniref:Exosome complex component CSL4 n=1 Tax=Tetrahymena thermophila (strain SB210) TaxID=312017 RepID=Q22Y72_TETTS|nr:exosome complex component CSL4 [Tetrahymena thermophila SB210]EAR90152.2 exosome complex component CSL4 [Tetrahymena thermophila SB210]|eukprot:XP_001010397.2 exosome complex component CSL4 [Tetrahymena thermophila SB210]
MNVYLPGQSLNLPQGNVRYSAGQGCYELNGKIFASICGKCQIDKDNIVSIVPLGNKVANLQVGSIVTAKVLRIRDNKVEVKIMMVEDAVINYNLQGIIRKQDVRQTNLDILKMEEQFIPGDIIKARFISYGDSQKLYLSVTEDELGVVFAKHTESKQLMIPFSWEEMICVQTGQKEKRKVAKPNISLFSAQMQ